MTFLYIRYISEQRSQTALRICEVYKTVPPSWIQKYTTFFIQVWNSWKL